MVSEDPKRKVDPFAAALADYSIGVIARKEAQAENYNTFTGLNVVQQNVLSRYEDNVLRPRGAIWYSALTKLAEAPYTGWNASKGTLWWDFKARKLEDVGDNEKAQISVRIEAEIPNKGDHQLGAVEVTFATLLTRSLIGEVVSDSTVMTAARILEIPRPQSWIAKRLGHEPKNPPSREEQHQASGVAILKRVDKLTATVYVTPTGGKREKIKQATIHGSEIKRPEAIKAKFFLPVGYRSEIELTEDNIKEFLSAWSMDKTLKSEVPELDSLIAFLEKQLPGEIDKDFSTFESILATINSTVNEYDLVCSVGKPEYVIDLEDRRRRRRSYS